jgi:hypothetical protein
VVDEPSPLETTAVDLPPEMIASLAAFAPLFSNLTWVKAPFLAVGAILATGNRTVCSLLRIMGLSQDPPVTNSHRVRNRDAWSCRAAGQVLLGLILALIPSDWPGLTHQIFQEFEPEPSRGSRFASRRDDVAG